MKIQKPKPQPKGIVANKLELCRNEKKQYWLMKSEPSSYSIDDLAKDRITLWDGVRNYQARNMMMQEMKTGDEVLYYHSSATPTGVVGTATVHSKAVPDETAFDPKSKYYDPKSTKKKPRWYCVKIKFKSKLKRIVTLEEMKKKKGLEEMLVIRKGQRLSIQPVTKKEFEIILRMGIAKGAK